MSIDRKALARQYKETPRTMGVGVVRNTTTGKVLLLAGRDIPALLNRHKAQLKFNASQVRTLQADWNALGEAKFEFQVVDTLEPSDKPGYDPADDLRQLEAMWMEKLAPYEPTGYHRPPRPAP